MLLVGVTSVGSGSVIMIALVEVDPGPSAVRLVGTDLVQAVPLVLAAAISNIAIHGLDVELLIPLVIGSVPGTILGSKAGASGPGLFTSARAIVVVLTMSGVALLDKSGWAPLGEGRDLPAADRRHRGRDGGAGAADLGTAAQGAGPADVGAPTVAELEDPTYRGKSLDLGILRPRTWLQPRPATRRAERACFVVVTRRRINYTFAPPPRHHTSIATS